jgi:hypothetical protein
VVVMKAVEVRAARRVGGLAGEPVYQVNILEDVASRARVE